MSDPAVRRGRGHGSSTPDSGGGIAARVLAWTLAVAAVLALAAVSLPAQVRRPTNRPPAHASTRHPPLKAIFERAATPLDIDFKDVFFTAPTRGWACGARRSPAGKAGVIVATRDAGQTWDVQHQDAGGTNASCLGLSFVDEAHGWALDAAGILRRTTDGATWEVVNRVPAGSTMVFRSPERGFLLDGSTAIRASGDGGRTWQVAYDCRVNFAAASNGEPCIPASLAYAPDTVTGYVVTRATSNGSSLVIRTIDGGTTWTSIAAIPETDGTGGALAFTTAATGYLRAGRTLLRTVDGGVTWDTVDAVVPDGHPRIAFSGSVGWMVGGSEFTYTFDGGLRWLTRRINFPARVVSFSLPDGDTGYVAGDRGLMYRYRVVPFKYSVADMLTIPAMTAFASGIPQ